jgi:predicted  nucleic acid-binding Zn-ribbon protein
MTDQESKESRMFRSQLTEVEKRITKIERELTVLTHQIKKIPKDVVAAIEESKRMKK